MSIHAALSRHALESAMAVVAPRRVELFRGEGEQRVFVVVVTDSLAACGGRIGAETDADRVYSLPSMQSGSSQLSWPRDEKSKRTRRCSLASAAFPPFRANSALAALVSLSLALYAHRCS